MFETHSSLGARELPDESNDALAEEEEEQDVRHHHEEENAFVQPGADSLLATENSRLLLAAFHCGFAHGAALGGCIVRQEEKEEKDRSYEEQDARIHGAKVEGGRRSVVLW